MKTIYIKLITSCFSVVLDAFSPALARKIFSIIGNLPWPSPSDGTEKPVALQDADKQVMNFESLELRGWVLGNKIILPTPGHSPCSVSLYWPDQKALFVSDADWIGNPVFLASSLRDSLASLNQILEYTEAGYVELLIPAHGCYFGLSLRGKGTGRQSNPCLKYD